MRRRDFIKVIARSAAAWPLAARAQQSDHMRRIGVLAPYTENDPEAQARILAFKQRLQTLGWTDNRNIRVDYRFTGGSTENIRAVAAQLVALAPDVIVGAGNPAATALRQATPGIPIIFTEVSDPVGGGLVASLARPGGNVTGFHSFETAIGGKWLEVLKQVAPAVNRVAVIYGPEIAANVAFLHAAETASGPLGVTVIPAAVHSAADIEPVLSAFAREPNGGLIVAPHPVTIVNRDLIIALAARLRLPTVYPYRYFPAHGGLVSYGYDQVEVWRGAASYVDRVLRGVNPGELPVQLPIKFELVINLKAAKALGLDVSLSLQQRADEVIE